MGLTGQVLPHKPWQTISLSSLHCWNRFGPLNSSDGKMVMLQHRKTFYSIQVMSTNFYGVFIEVF